MGLPEGTFRHPSACLLASRVSQTSSDVPHRLARVDTEIIGQTQHTPAATRPLLWAGASLHSATSHPSVRCYGLGRPALLPPATRPSVAVGWGIAAASATSHPSVAVAAGIAALCHQPPIAGREHHRQFVARQASRTLRWNWNLRQPLGSQPLQSCWGSPNQWLRRRCNSVRRSAPDEGTE